MTLIEVLVAITVLLVGVLGVVSMIDGASAVTARNKAREGATNVARSVIEVGRSVRYRDLSATELINALESRPGLADAKPSAGHTVSTRGYFYDVTVQVCSMDDPVDGLGLAESAIPFCPESTPAASASDARDRNPDDYRRISVTLEWKRGASVEKTKQTSIVPNPVGGLGPSVNLRARDYPPGSVKITNAGTSTIAFTATTTANAADLTWAINGNPQGSAAPVGSSKREFTFTWDIAGSSGGQYWYDCTYIVQATASDEQGRSGKPGAVTVVLNRRHPFEPPFFEGGRNGNGNRVDLQWRANPECDVLGYRVFRRVGSGSWEPVDCGESGDYLTKTTCLDEDAPPPGSGSLSYQVRAVDTLDGEPRNGDPAELTVVEGDPPPGVPTSLSACLGGTPGCNGPDGELATGGVTVVSWHSPSDGDVRFYRVYRDGTTYAHRHDVFFPTSSGGLAWIDPETPDGQSHTYYLTAVDTNYGESALSDPVTFP